MRVFCGATPPARAPAFDRNALSRKRRAFAARPPHGRGRRVSAAAAADAVTPGAGDSPDAAERPPTWVFFDSEDGDDGDAEEGEGDAEGDLGPPPQSHASFGVDAEARAKQVQRQVFGEAWNESSPAGLPSEEVLIPRAPVAAAAESELAPPTLPGIGGRFVASILPPEVVKAVPSAVSFASQMLLMYGFVRAIRYVRRYRDRLDEADLDPSSKRLRMLDGREVPLSRVPEVMNFYRKEVARETEALKKDEEAVFWAQMEAGDERERQQARVDAGLDPEPATTTIATPAPDSSSPAELESSEAPAPAPERVQALNDKIRAKLSGAKANYPDRLEEHELEPEPEPEPERTTSSSSSSSSSWGKQIAKRSRRNRREQAASALPLPEALADPDAAIEPELGREEPAGTQRRGRNPLQSRTGAATADRPAWLDLPCVYVLLARNAGEPKGSARDADDGGLMLVDMATRGHALYHAVAFEDREEAQDFCYLYRSQHLDGSSGTLASFTAYSPEELNVVCTSAGYPVTVVPRGLLGEALEPGAERGLLMFKIKELANPGGVKALFEDRLKGALKQAVEEKKDGERRR